ncbi:MAG TPA: hypothetical protein VGY55_12495 [Pirellulales bacterium]|nr:hypothetical protein [Pirellulales bacterium]
MDENPYEPPQCQPENPSSGFAIARFLHALRWVAFYWVILPLALAGIAFVLSAIIRALKL